MDTIRLNPDFVKEYTRRVSDAGPVGLVVITYELILDFIDMALEHIDADVYLRQAEKGVCTLMAGLDFSQPMAHDLFNLYVYINKKLIIGEISEAADLLTVLLEGWRAIESPVKTQAIRYGFIRRGSALAEYEEQDRRIDIQA